MKTRLTGLVLAVVLFGCGGPPTGGTGGGSGGSGGGGGSGGSGGGGSGTINPMPCTAGGAAVAPAEIRGQGVELSYSSSSFVAAGSDLTGSLTKGPSVRLNLTPQAAGNPAHTELSVFVNGCSVGKLTDVGEEYWWTTRPSDPTVSVAAGKSLVVEVVRTGKGVILRRVFAMPAVLPKITSPAAHAAITAPVVLKWDPMQLPSGSKLGATAWKVASGGSGQSDGFLSIADPASGQTSWNAGKSTWTSIELQADLTFEPNVTFYVAFHLPVN